MRSFSVAASKAPPTFDSLLEALTGLARSRKATSTRPAALHAALALAPSPAGVNQALHASFLRGNVVPTAATSSLVSRALLAGVPAAPSQEGRAEAVREALGVLVNRRLRLPPSGAAFGALLRAAPREAGSALPRDIVRAALARGVQGSAPFTVHSVAALCGAGDFAAATLLLQRRLGSSQPGSRRAAFALFSSLKRQQPPWGLSASRLDWLQKEALPLLTTPKGKELRQLVEPMLLAAREAVGRAQAAGGEGAGAAAAAEQAAAAAPEAEGAKAEAAAGKA